MEKNKIKLFDSRNNMIQFYCNRIVNPCILEIGVFKGDFLNFLAKNCLYSKIFAIDLFEGTTFSGDKDGNNVEYVNLNLAYSELLEYYKNTENIHIQKISSNNFLLSQKDNTFDIIYIDGDHSYDGVKKDLNLSYLKIKNQGYIMGHDYEMNYKKTKNNYNFDVKRAVDEFCKIYNLYIESKGMDGCISYCIKINK